MARLGAPRGNHGVTYESLSQKYLIAPEAAKILVQKINQQGIRKILHLYLSRLLNKNERVLRYNRLHHNSFTDTIQSGNVSIRMKQYAQG